MFSPFLGHYQEKQQSERKVSRYTAAQKSANQLCVQSEKKKE
jgi:hypothetical protein